MRFVTRAIPRGDSKTCFPIHAGRAATLTDESVSAVIKPIARYAPSCISLIVRGAHDLETSAVLETGRTCKSAAVCALATLSKRLSDRDPWQHG